MTTQAGLLYELTFSVDAAVATEFDRWLTELDEQARHKDGIVDSRVFEVRSDIEGRLARVFQIQCIDDNALSEFQDTFFTGTSSSVTEEFGDTVSVTSRVLREDTPHDLPDIPSPNCLNCGSRLKGQYCAACGQRAHSRLISLWELISDAFGDLLEFDSRLWRTLIPLLRRPGQLTRDYLEGRRARYMPPFRTYLVLSVIFFVVAFFDPRDDLSLLFEPEPEPTAAEIAEKEAQVAAAKKEILDELAAEGIIPENRDRQDRAGEIDERVADAAATDEGGLTVQIGDDSDSCDVSAEDLADAPEWFKRRFTPERVREVCEKVTADGGKSFGDLLLDNIPVALIVLLPLMALVLKTLYPLSRRYFVEHLLFVIHYHAFFFLILILLILFARFAPLILVPDLVTTLAIVAASFYIPVYLYVAMRQVYGQGRFLTFLKYLTLVVSYSVGTALTMFGAVLFALVSV